MPATGPDAVIWDATRARRPFLLQFAADNEFVVSSCRPGTAPASFDPPGPTAREPQEPS